MTDLTVTDTAKTSDAAKPGETNQPADDFFRGVLVPLDGSDLSAKALRPARQLADALQVPLRVVSFPAKRHLDMVLDAVRFQIEPFDVDDVMVESLEGGIAERIVAEALADVDDLVVMASTSQSHTGHIFGSVAEAVIERLGRSVMLVGPDFDRLAGFSRGRVVVAVKGTSHVARMADVAVRWAKALDLPLELVHSSDTARLAGLVAAGVEDAAADETEYIRQLLEAMSDQLGHRVDLKTVPDDHFEKLIVREAASEDTALVAVAATDHHGLTRLVSGSTAAAVVKRSTCPVLVAPDP